MDEHPFLMPGSLSWPDMLTDAAFWVLGEKGLPGLSIRALAARVRVTAPALTQRWGGERGARAEILRVVTITFGDRFHLWSRASLTGENPTLSLPATSDERDGVRTWLALRELARAELAIGNPRIAAVAEGTMTMERDDVQAWVRCPDGSPLPDASAAGICALADGLRSSLVAAEPAIGVDAATGLLRRHIEVARRERATAG